MASPDYCKGPRGGSRHLPNHLISISQPKLLPSAWAVAPLPSRYPWLETSPPAREQSVQEVLSSPAREGWPGKPGMATPASWLQRSSLRCLICQTPMATRMRVCRMDHHSTLWLVLSLVCRSVFRHCGKGKQKRSLSWLGLIWGH